MDHHDDQDLMDMLDYNARQLQEKNELIELQNRQLKDKDKQISVLQQKYLRLRALMRGAPQPVAPPQNRVHTGGALLAPPLPPRQHSGAVSLAPQPQPQHSGLSSSSSTVRIESSAAIDSVQRSFIGSLDNQIPAELPSPANVPQSSPFQAVDSPVVLMAQSTRAEPNRVQMHNQPTYLNSQPSISNYYPDYSHHHQQPSIRLANQMPPNVPHSSPFQAGDSAAHVMLTTSSTQFEPNRVQTYKPTSFICQPSTSSYYPDYSQHQQQHQSPVNTDHNNIQHNQELLNLNVENNNREVMENAIQGGEQETGENAQFGTYRPQVDYGEEARITGDFGYARVVVIKPEDVKEEGEYETTNRNGTVIETIEVKDEDDDDYDDYDYDEEEYEEEEEEDGAGDEGSRFNQMNNPNVLIDNVTSYDGSMMRNELDLYGGPSSQESQNAVTAISEQQQQRPLSNSLELMMRGDANTGSDSAQVVNRVQVPNPQPHPPSSLIWQPSTSSAFSPYSRPQQSIDYDPENDPEILAQVEREIKEEENEKALQNAQDNRQSQQFGQRIENDEFGGFEEEEANLDNNLEHHQQQFPANSLDHNVHNRESNANEDEDGDEVVDDHVDGEDESVEEQSRIETATLRVVSTESEMMEEIDGDQITTTNASTSAVSNEPSNHNLIDGEEDREEDQVNLITQQFDDEPTNGEIVEEDNFSQTECHDEQVTNSLTNPRASTDEAATEVAPDPLEGTSSGSGHFANATISNDVSTITTSQSPNNYNNTIVPIGSPVQVQDSAELFSIIFESQLTQVRVQLQELATKYSVDSANVNSIRTKYEQIQLDYRELKSNANKSMVALLKELNQLVLSAAQANAQTPSPETGLTDDAQYCFQVDTTQPRLIDFDGDDQVTDTGPPTKRQQIERISDDEHDVIEPNEGEDAIGVNEQSGANGLTIGESMDGLMSGDDDVQHYPINAIPINDECANEQVVTTNSSPFPIEGHHASSIQSPPSITSQSSSSTQHVDDILPDELVNEEQMDDDGHIEHDDDDDDNLSLNETDSDRDGDDDDEETELDDAQSDGSDSESSSDDQMEDVADGQDNSSQQDDTNGSDDQVHVPAVNYIKTIKPDKLGNKFECDYRGCGKRMKLKTNLIRHIQTLHTGEMHFKCTVTGCGRAFVQKSNLEYHITTHTNRRPFICKWRGCDARFATKATLKGHRKTHTNEREHRCNWPDCGKAFNHACALKGHLRMHTGERPFACEQCDAKFATSGKLTIHRRTHTGEKPYECDWPGCSQAYSKSYSLTIHRRLHTGERPYACDVPDCGQAFVSSSHLKYHSLAHTGERPYACDVVGCPKTYKNTTGLRSHKKAVHNRRNHKNSVHNRH